MLAAAAPTPGNAIWPPVTFGGANQNGDFYGGMDVDQATGASYPATTFNGT